MLKIIGNTVGTTMNPKKVASIGQKTKLSEFINDEGFIKSADVPTNLSQLKNDEGYVDKEYVDGAVNKILNGFSVALADVIAYQRDLIGE